MSRELAYFAPPLPHILAHRGLHVKASENSLRAFELALDAGATHLETDVRCTRDGVPVLVHNSAIQTMFGVMRISEVAYVELVEAAASQELCTLKEALERFPTARFNIDVKELRAVSATCAVVRDSGAENRVLLASFDESTRLEIRKSLPEVPTSASRRIVLQAMLFSAFGLRRALKLALADVTALQVPVCFGPLPVINRRLIRRCHEEDILIHVWTINEPAQMRRLLTLGVDGIVTDRCDLARTVQAE